MFLFYMDIWNNVSCNKDLRYKCKPSFYFGRLKELNGRVLSDKKYSIYISNKHIGIILGIVVNPMQSVSLTKLHD